MNRRQRNCLLALVVIPAALAAQGGPRGGTSVTLFNSGRVLVRRTLMISIPAGTSTQTMPLGDYLPSTFNLLDDGATLVRVVSSGPVDEGSLLRRNIGRTFEIANGEKPRRHATLLSMDPERWQWSGADAGGVVFGRPGQVVWPADVVPTASIADVTLHSDRARQSIAVMYEATGGAWSASYHLFLGTHARLEGGALINAGPVELRDAEVQLLAGNIGVRMSAQSAPRMQMAAATNGFEEAAITTGAVDEAVGDAHVYTIPGRLSLMPGSDELVPLFDPVTVRPVREYAVVGAIPYYGGFSENNNVATVPVNVAYRMDRKMGTAFGDLALPAGSVSVFDADRGGKIQLIGAGSIAHVAAGDTVRVQAGAAFDVTARRVQTDFRQRDEGGHRVSYATITTTLQNAKDSAVVVDVNEDRSGEWSVLTSTIPPIKRSSSRRSFMVPVPAKDTASVTYSVRVVW